MSSNIPLKTGSPNELPDEAQSAIASEEKEVVHVIEDVGEVETDPKETNAPLDMIAAPSTQYTSSKTMRLLRLVQMYNDIHSKYLQECFTAMLWNLTKSRRALLARANPNSVVHLPMLQASLLHPERSFSAQRRLFPEDDVGNSKVENDDNTNVAWTFEASDEHGGRRNLPPLLVEEESGLASDPPSDTTGLRQRNVGTTARASASNDVGTVADERDSTTSIPDDPMQLLLLSSNGLFASKTIPASLQKAQEDSIRLLQYACLLSEIQASIAQIIGQ